MPLKTLLRRAALAVLCALALAGAAAGAEEAEAPQYVENDWNFVDGSMDVSQGIPASAEGVLGRIRQAGVLRVATEPYFPPQEFIDPTLTGQDAYVGADMDLARLIAVRMRVRLEIVPMEFSQVLAAVDDGECDLAISALAYTPIRASAVEMSKGYHFAADGLGTGLLIREADTGTITSAADLTARNIAAQRGSLQEALMANIVPAYREFRRLVSMQEVYQAVSDGLVDAAAVDIESTQAWLQANPDCGLALVPGVSFTLDEHFDGDRVAGRKGELQLMYFVNGVIDEILSDGRYERWLSEYGEYAERLGL